MVGKGKEPAEQSTVGRAPPIDRQLDDLHRNFAQISADRHTDQKQWGDAFEQQAAQLTALAEQMRLISAKLDEPPNRLVHPPQPFEPAHTEVPAPSSSAHTTDDSQVTHDNPAFASRRLPVATGGVTVAGLAPFSNPGRTPHHPGSSHPAPLHDESHYVRANSALQHEWNTMMRVVRPTFSGDQNRTAAFCAEIRVSQYAHFWILNTLKYANSAASVLSVSCIFT